MLTGGGVFVLEGGTSAAGELNHKDDDDAGVVLMPLSSPFGGAPIGAFIISPTGRGTDMRQDARKWTTTSRESLLVEPKPLGCAFE